MQRTLWERLLILFGKEDRYADLKTFPIFKGWKQHELYQVNNIVNQRSYKAGESLYVEGYPMEAIYLIQSGEVCITGVLQSGGSESLGKGCMIGLVDLFYKSNRVSTAQAIGEVSCLAISKTDLDHLIDHNPNLGIKLLRAIAAYLSKWIVEESPNLNREDELE